jgi:hypothetical protein
MIAVISQKMNCIAAVSTACGLQDWKIAERMLCYSAVTNINFSAIKQEHYLTAALWMAFFKLAFKRDEDTYS